MDISKSNRTKIKKTAKFSLYILVIGILGYFIYHNVEHIQNLFFNYYRQTLIIILITFLGLVSQSLSFIQLAKNNALPLIGTMRIWSISSLLNYLGPFQPGVLARSYFFSKYGLRPVDTFSISLKLVFNSLWLTCFVVVICAQLITPPFYEWITFFFILFFFVLTSFASIVNKLKQSVFKDKYQYYFDLTKQTFIVDSVNLIY
jgi:hypothetical protein